MFATQLQIAHVEHGAPGQPVLEDLEPEQELAQQVLRARHLKPSSAGTVQQALTLTVLDALSLLREAT